MFKRAIMLFVAIIFPVTLAAENSPLEVVAKVLSLSQEQIRTLAQIVQGRGDALRPAVEALHAREQALAQQLQSADPDPQIVGQLIIEMKKIQDQVHAAIEETNKQFETVLTPEQATRLHDLRGAAQACDVVPALKAVGLM